MQKNFFPPPLLKIVFLSCPIITTNNVMCKSFLTVCNSYWSFWHPPKFTLSEFLKMPTMGFRSNCSWVFEYNRNEFPRNTRKWLLRVPATFCGAMFLVGICKWFSQRKSILTISWNTQSEFLGFWKQFRSVPTMSLRDEVPEERFGRWNRLKRNYSTFTKAINSFERS